MSNADATTQRAAGPERCPYCDYSLAGLVPDRCPECGNPITDDDLRLDARRRLFLELTRWRVVGVNLLVLFLAAGHGLGLAVAPLTFALSASAARIPPPGSRPGLVRRLQRRAWLLSLWWLFLPWAVLPLLRLLSWGWLAPFRFIAGPLGGVLELVDALGPAGHGAFHFALWVGAVLVWRRRLASIARLAGLESGRGGPFPPKLATRLAIYPTLVLVGGGTLLLGGLDLLDRFAPGWGVGL